MRLFSGALLRRAGGALAFEASSSSSSAIAEELGTELTTPKSALGGITRCQRTRPASRSEMDTDYGGDGSDRVGGGSGNSDHSGGGTGAGWVVMVLVLVLIVVAVVRLHVVAASAVAIAPTTYASTVAARPDASACNRWTRTTSAPRRDGSSAMPLSAARALSISSSTPARITE